MKQYRIILADDHAMFRKGMKRLIDGKPGLKVVGEANDGSELLRCMSRLKPDMVILDVSMPGIGGIGAVREIRLKYPKVKVLMLTMHKNTEYLYVALATGAKGYLLKEDSDIELFTAIETIQNGGEYVTRCLAGELAEDLCNLQRGKGRLPLEPLSIRERQILKLIAEGRANREVAEFLQISIRTAENHRSKIMKKLKLTNTAQLVRYAIEKGIIELET